MCPACIQNMAIVLVGLTSTSGLAALVMTRQSPKKDPATNEISDKKDGELNQGGPHA